MKLTIALVALLLGLYATDSSAQLFRLNVKDYGLDPSTPGYAAFKGLVDSEIAKIEADINKDLPSAPPERLMEGMANSSVMAGKGIGSDYASNMQVFLIGAGVGAGADLEKDPDTDSDISGVGVAPGVVLGLNLGFMDAKRFLGMETDRLNLYLNFMKYGHEQQVNNEPGKESAAELDMMALGVHFRYDWIPAKGTKWLGWGGVKFHFGYEYNKTDITFDSKISEHVDSSSGGFEIEGDIEANPKAIINVATHSIPLELSTDIQLLYVLSLYTGLGVDYNFGKATGQGTLNADPSNINCTGGAGCTAAGNPTAEVQASADINGSGKVNPFTYRAFAGAQINLPYLRIFGQVDKELGSELIGATAGVRFVF